MKPDPPSPAYRLVLLRERLCARAAGWWTVAGDRLEQVAVVFAADMPEAVVGEFASATRAVALAQTDLGIVRAVLSGEPTVSRVEELSSDAGSGLWLRRFGAARSVAVPLRDRSGAVAAVVSVALAGDAPDDPAVAEAVRELVVGAPDIGRPGLDE